MIYTKIFITLYGVYLFVIYLPHLIIKRFLLIKQLHADELFSRFISWRIVWVFGLIGLIMYLWTVFIQVKRGRGTPIPLLPPEKLLVDAPYSFCRNPMVLGAIMFYFGLCSFIGSWDAFYIVASVAIVLLVYAKFWEESELESRFGQVYYEYKRQTPFLIPKIFGKRWYFLFLR